MPVKAFDIPVSIDVDHFLICWPDETQLAYETDSANAEYEHILVPDDLADFPRSERAMIARFTLAEDEAPYEDWQENIWRDAPFLLGFDLGTNALSAALAATGCVPFYGCNAGSFGGEHAELHPVVAFFVPPHAMGTITAAALASGAGLRNGHAGSLVAYADSVSLLVDMAEALLRSSGSGEGVASSSHKAS